MLLSVLDPPVYVILRTRIPSSCHCQSQNVLFLLLSEPERLVLVIVRARTSSSCYCQSYNVIAIVSVGLCQYVNT